MGRRILADLSAVRGRRRGQESREGGETGDSDAEVKLPRTQTTSQSISPETHGYPCWQLSIRGLVTTFRFCIYSQAWVASQPYRLCGLGRLGASSSRLKQMGQKAGEAWVSALLETVRATARSCGKHMPARTRSSARMVCDQSSRQPSHTMLLPAGKAGL